MRFVDCIDIVGRKPDKYIGVKKYISTGAVGNNNEIIPTEIELYTYEDRPSRANLIAKVGNILFAKMADTKKVLMVDEANSNYLFSTGFFSIAPKKGILTSECLYYLLNSNIFQRQKDKYSSGATQKAITNKGLEKIIVNIPPKEKQVTISKELDLAISLINKYKLIITQLDNSIKARFVEMFGDPETNPHGYIKAPMGDYMTLLTDFSSNGSYKTLDSGVTMYDEPNFAWMVRTIDLESGDMTSIKYIDESAYELLGKSKLFGGEIIMNKIGSAGKVYLMPEITMPASLGRNAFMFRYDDRVNVKYLFHLLTSEYGQREIQQYVRGAVTKTITKNDARAVLIIVPPIELQNEYVAFVEQVDKSKVAVQKALDEAQLLFDSLMQKYFG